MFRKRQYNHYFFEDLPTMRHSNWIIKFYSQKYSSFREWNENFVKFEGLLPIYTHIQFTCVNLDQTEASDQGKAHFLCRYEEIMLFELSIVYYMIFFLSIRMSWFYSGVVRDRISSYSTTGHLMSYQKYLCTYNLHFVTN